MTTERSEEHDWRDRKPVLTALIDDIRTAAENETADPKRKHLLEMLVVGYRADLVNPRSLDAEQAEADEMRRHLLLWDERFSEDIPSDPLLKRTWVLK